MPGCARALTALIALLVVVVERAVAPAADEPVRHKGHRLAPHVRYAVTSRGVHVPVLPETDGEASVGPGDYLLAADLGPVSVAFEDSPDVAAADLVASGGEGGHLVSGEQPVAVGLVDADPVEGKPHVAAVPELLPVARAADLAVRTLRAMGVASFERRRGLLVRAVVLWWIMPHCCRL